VETSLPEDECHGSAGRHAETERCPSKRADIACKQMSGCMCLGSTWIQAYVYVLEIGIENKVMILCIEKVRARIDQSLYLRIPLSRSMRFRYPIHQITKSIKIMLGPHFPFRAWISLEMAIPN
jgi:hypothetical protein